MHVDQVEVIYMGNYPRHFKLLIIENYLCPGGNCPSSIDGTYTAGPSEYITVENPNGGESLETGDIININWDSNADSNVSIKLYINNTFNSNITTNTTNDGTYTWSIPNSVASGSNYKIKITSNSNSDIYDFSDSTFSITASPSVNLSIGEIDVDNGTLDIDMSSESAVSGFQFVLSDYPNAINITGASGGISGSYGFTTSSNESGTIPSFSLTGAQIPAGNHTLVEIDFEILNWEAQQLFA